MMMGPIIVIGGVVIAACGGFLWYLEKKQPAIAANEPFLGSLTVVPSDLEPMLLPLSEGSPSQAIAEPAAVEAVGRNDKSDNMPVDNPMTLTSTVRTLKRDPNLVEPPQDATNSDRIIGLSNAQLKDQVADLCLKLREFDQTYRDKIDQLKKSRTRENNKLIAQFRQERAEEFKSNYSRDASALFRELVVASGRALPMDSPRALRLGVSKSTAGPALTSAKYLERMVRRLK